MHGVLVFLDLAEGFDPNTEQLEIESSKVNCRYLFHYAGLYRYAFFPVCKVVSARHYRDVYRVALYAGATVALSAGMRALVTSFKSSNETSADSVIFAVEVSLNSASS